jgi:hypothetical protein
VQLIVFFTGSWLFGLLIIFNLETDLLLQVTLSYPCLPLSFIFIFVSVVLALSFGFLNYRKLLNALEILDGRGLSRGTACDDLFQRCFEAWVVFTNKLEIAF